jgi:hypothetical protein
VNPNRATKGHFAKNPTILLLGSIQSQHPITHHSACKNRQTTQVQKETTIHTQSCQEEFMRIVSTLLLVALASIITACPATPIAVGKLVVKITGLAVGVPSEVAVSGPNNFKQTIIEASATDKIGTITTISNLPVGAYKIEAKPVSPNDVTFTATVDEANPIVAANATTTVNVVYAAAAAQ